jgi:alpha-ketoglutarate-dependent taurine dioxygenase
MAVTALTPVLGVEISGVSGREFVDRRRADESLELLQRHSLLVYREANIDDADLVEFSRMLGDVVVAPVGSIDGHPEVSKVTLDPAQSALANYRLGTFHWHLDGANDLVPQKATLLTAREVDDEGGDTEFASMYAAYDALSAEERTEIEDLRVVHSFAASQRRLSPDASEKERAMWDRVPSREHPLVWRRRDGRASLLIGFTAEGIVGWPEAESEALLDRLLAWVTQPQFVVRHHWQVGDLVVWDNTGLLHRALPYSRDSRRLMHRTTLVGDEEVA